MTTTVPTKLRKAARTASRAVSRATTAPALGDRVKRTTSAGKTSVAKVEKRFPKGPFRIPEEDRLPPEAMEEALEIVRKTAKAVQKAWDEGTQDLEDLLDDHDRPKGQYKVRATLEQMPVEERLRRARGGARIEFVLCYNHCD